MKTNEELCCNHFLDIAKTFGWFTMEEYKEGVVLMPYIKETKYKLRVNFCPSCGKNVRDIELNKELLNQENNEPR